MYILGASANTNMKYAKILNVWKRFKIDKRKDLKHHYYYI